MGERVKPERERPPARILTQEEVEKGTPKGISGVKITFKRKPKKDKMKDLLGDRLKGITIRGDETTLVLDSDLSPSDREKIQKIVDGE